MYVCTTCGTELQPNGVCPNCGKTHEEGTNPNQKQGNQDPNQKQGNQDPNAPASGIALASLITGILCFFIGGPILAIIATWLGATALNDYNTHGGSVSTQSYAKLGRKLGFICIWIWVGFIVLYFLVIVVGFSMFRF